MRKVNLESRIKSRLLGIGLISSVLTSSCATPGVLENNYSVQKVEQSENIEEETYVEEKDNTFYKDLFEGVLRVMSISQYWMF